MEIILASGSPRRAALMKDAGYSFTVFSPDAEEVSTGNPEDVVRQNALLKAAAAGKVFPDRVILAADTVVYLPGERRILGKPADENDARGMLRALSGAWHHVYTGVCLKQGDKILLRCDMAQVLFDDLTDEMISDYIATGEPMDKAGAYAIQGIGCHLVKSVSGSLSCVIGLPMHLVREMLKDFDI